jgi:cyclophilin family peptidyl-prolyl cis-trans isomerase
MSIDPNKSYTATFDTSRGNIVVELFPKDAPKTVNNFVFLARDGYYDGTTFHRVIADFMVQGGDPTATGRGGPGYKFEDELKSNPRKHAVGTLSMANAGPNTNGSQFFIMQENYPLPPNYVIFARVTDGMAAVDAIANLPTMSNGRGESSKPVTTPIIKKVTIQP